MRRVRSSPCATRRAMLTPLPEAPECGRVPATCAGTARAAHGPCRARGHRQEFSRRHEVLIQRQSTRVLGHAGPPLIRLFSSGVSAPEIVRGRWWRNHLQEAPSSSPAFAPAACSSSKRSGTETPSLRQCLAIATSEMPFCLARRCFGSDQTGSWSWREGHPSCARKRTPPTVEAFAPSQAESACKERTISENVSVRFPYLRQSQARGTGIQHSPGTVSAAGCRS